MGQLREKEQRVWKKVKASIALKQMKASGADAETQKQIASAVYVCVCVCVDMYVYVCIGEATGPRARD